MIVQAQNCRAKVVGGTTYGKGLIQGVFGLSDGGALVTTVASYATPSGREINLTGIRPDEPHTFVSDVLGSNFVDLDVKSAGFAAPTCTDTPEIASIFPPLRGGAAPDGKLAAR